MKSILRRQSNAVKKNSNPSKPSKITFRPKINVKTGNTEQSHNLTQLTNINPKYLKPPIHSNRTCKSVNSRAPRKKNNLSSNIKIKQLQLILQFNCINIKTRDGNYIYFQIFDMIKCDPTLLDKLIIQDSRGNYFGTQLLQQVVEKQMYILKLRKSKTIKPHIIKLFEILLLDNNTNRLINSIERRNKKQPLLNNNTKIKYEIMEKLNLTSDEFDELIKLV